KTVNPISEGMHTLTPHLWFSGRGRDAIDFYQKALSAVLITPIVPGSNGSYVAHALLRIGDSHFIVADADPGSWEAGPDEHTTASLWIFTRDCDKLFHQAVRHGCQILRPIMDSYWGDRVGKIKDPFGHCWTIASNM